MFRNFSSATQNTLVLFTYHGGKNSWQGSQTTVYVALQPGVERQTGSMFSECRNRDFVLPK